MVSPIFAKFDRFSLDSGQILPKFCRIFPIKPRRNVRGPIGYPTGYPTGSPQFAFSRKTSYTAPPRISARSCARPQAAALRDFIRGVLGHLNLFINGNVPLGGRGRGRKVILRAVCLDKLRLEVEGSHFSAFLRPTYLIYQNVANCFL